MLLLLLTLLTGCATRAPRLLDPDDRAWSQTAPERYRVVLETSAGVIQIDIDRALAPLGADRFYNLVRAGYYDGCRFDRVIPGFIAQFGFAADPAVTAAQAKRSIPLEPVLRTNARGTLAWSNSGLPDSRSTVVFVNLGDNPHLDRAEQTVFGEVTLGMEILDRLPESCPDLRQEPIQREGEPYLAGLCPELLVIHRAVALPTP